jgi:N-acetyl-gamma-glutamylphosphate reductase
MFVVADNLRKGAATNAVQIAELLLGGEFDEDVVAGAGTPGCVTYRDTAVSWSA